MKKLFLFGFAGVILCISPQLLTASCPVVCDCKEGALGPIGPQGAAGAQGAQGDQGATGIKGDIGDVGPCCSTGIPDWANIYSQIDQVIGAFGALNDTVIFEGINGVSSGIDVSLASSTGAITFLKNGTYKIDYSAEGIVTSGGEFVWSLGLYLNGVLIPGSAFGGYNDDPSEFAASTSGTVIIRALSGQVLLLRSNSTAPFNIVSSGVGINPVASATIKVTVLNYL